MRNTLIVWIAGMWKTNLILEKILNSIKCQNWFICYDSHGQLHNYLIVNEYITDCEIIWHQIAELNINNIIEQINNCNFIDIIKKKKRLFITLDLKINQWDSISNLLIKKINEAIKYLSTDKIIWFKIFFDEAGVFINNYTKELLDFSKQTWVELVFSVQFLDSLKQNNIDLKEIIVKKFDTKEILFCTKQDADYLESKIDNFSIHMIQGLNVWQACKIRFEKVNRINISNNF